jgi:hypothetical protein
MSKAPEKIWYDPYEYNAGFGKLDDCEVQYVRADLVDELVEALEGACDMLDRLGYLAAEYRVVLAKVRGEKND